MSLPQEIIRAKRDGRAFIEAEIAIDRQDQLVDLVAFGGKLILGAENMRVVLRERAHPHHAMQRARRLIAMDEAEFGEAQRQICTWPGQFIGFSA